jgi:molybdenum cofactor cytidylyltransferase
MPSQLNLVQAFQIRKKPELVAFTGAGGKTSLMINLAKQLQGRVLLTTTTRMFAAQIESAAASLPAISCTYPDLAPLDRASGKSIVVGPLQGDKVTAVPLDLPQRLLARPDIDTVLVEADGSKMLPIKAPAAHEPALPRGVTLVVPAAGIDALHGRIIDVAHRPELVAGLLGKDQKDILSTADMAALLSHAEAGMKDVPADARVIPTINKVETPDQLAAARRIARYMLQQSRIQQVLLSSRQALGSVVEVQRRVTAVVLAAGQSRRMGRSKQLLPWGDTTVLGQTLRNLKESAIHDILVVTGAEAEKVSTIAQAEAVPTIHNEKYAAGEMLSSLKTAVAQLPNNRTAVLVMLADQPMVIAPIIDQLLHAYARGEGSIIAPEFDGRRGNPVLIDRAHFAELLALPPNAAPRDLLRRHPITLISSPSAVVLQDLDNLDDYNRLRPL